MNSADINDEFTVHQSALTTLMDNYKYSKLELWASEISGNVMLVIRVSRVPFHFKDLFMKVNNRN